jgi:hypothetical protein
MEQVTIIDRPCGSGKTTQIISSFKSDKKYLVIVPFLDEIERLIQGTKHYCEFIQPLSGNSNETKKHHLVELALSGKNIVTTHKLFESLVDIARMGLLDNYHIIIDEVPETLSVTRRISKKSLKDIYIDGGYLEVEKDGKVTPSAKWHNDNKDVSDTLSQKLYRQACGGCLFLVDESFFIWAMPKELLCAGISTTIYTYKSNGSVLCKYLEKEKIPYKIIWSQKEEKEFILKAQQLITFGSLPVGFKKIKFSYRQQEKKLTSAKDSKQVSMNLKNLRQRELQNVEANNIMITCIKAAWDDTNKHGGFKRGSRLASALWVANTTRGTNKYAHCSHAIYLYDQHLNPDLLHWLGVDNNKAFKEAYALTEFIQWLYRSRIRKGEPITVFIPSGRMERIFRTWLFSVEDDSSVAA